MAVCRRSRSASRERAAAAGKSVAAATEQPPEFVAPSEEADGKIDVEDIELEERIRTNVPRTILNMGRRREHF